MRKFIFPLILVIVVQAVIASACTATPPASPLPLGTPASDWKLHLTQTGGYIGRHLEVEVSGDGHLRATDVHSGQVVERSLSAAEMESLASVYAATSLKPLPPQHGGCADCFVYQLDARADGKSVSLQVDDTTIDQSGAGELIMLLRQLRDASFHGQP